MFHLKPSLPVQLILVIAGVFLWGGYIDESLLRFFYTFSLCFKEILSFCLPFIIFAYVVKGVLSFKKNAPFVLAVLLSAIFASNMIAALFSYIIASICVPLITQHMSISMFQMDNAIEPYYRLTLPFSFSSEYALMLAIAVGIFLSVVRLPHVEKSIDLLKDVVETFLNHYFIPLLPLYVLGFLLEVQHKGIFESLFVHYGKAFCVIFAAQITQKAFP